MTNTRKKQNRLPFIIAAVILIAAACFLGKRLYEKYGPSSEIMTEKELFGHSGREVAVLFNYELQSAYGIEQNGEVYLPYSFVYALLNDRFYYDKQEKLLVYALPEEIHSADEASAGSTGKPLFLVEDGEAWLSQAFVRGYTDMRTELYTDGDVKRIFIGTGVRKLTTAALKGKTKLRSRRSIKGDVISTLEKGETLTMIPDHPNDAPDEKWTRVKTEDGLVGYVSAKKLGEPVTERVSSSYKAPVYKRTALDKPVVLAWHQVTNMDANKYFDSLTKGADCMNVVSPTWFSLSDNEGNYASYARKDYVEAAHAKGMQVWPLIDNFNSNVTLGTLLERTSVRKKLIASLIADAEEYGFDGINIDFELVKQGAMKQYLQFVRELSVSMRKRGLVLSIDVPNYASYNAYYDREELGTVCDYVINMGYDEHVSVSDAEGPGPVSSMEFFEEGIRQTLEEVPKEKFVGGMPAYSRVWIRRADGKESTETITMRGEEKWAASHGVEWTYDESQGMNYGEYTDSDGGLHYMWPEDALSVTKRLELLKKYGAGGAAVWKLGIEDAGIWKLIGEFAD